MTFPPSQGAHCAPNPATSGLGIQLDQSQRGTHHTVRTGLLLGLRWLRGVCQQA